MSTDMQLGMETLKLLLECVRDLLTRRNIVLIDDEEWAAQDYGTPRISYGWSHPVTPHDKPSSLAGAIAMKLREALQKEAIDKWTKIVISLVLMQPVAPETRKKFLVTIKLA
jgi:hypothetical protein